jgi:hypothetical protein
MIPINDEVRYKNIINDLKQLSKVNSPPNFESDLLRKINSGIYTEKYKLRLWEYFFMPSRLIPAAAFVISIFAALYFLNFNSIEPDNPFLAQPKIRKSALRDPGKRSLSPKPPEYAEASINSSFKMNKEGLNFLHIRLNDTEKAKITRLKEQIRAYFNNNH